MNTAILLTIITIIIAAGAIIYYKTTQNPKIITKKQKRRLGLSAKINIDKNQSLVLIRRDDVEHLILINNEKTTLIESNIKQTQNETNQTYEKKQNPFLQYTKNIIKKANGETKTTQNPYNPELSIQDETQNKQTEPTLNPRKPQQ